MKIFAAARAPSWEPMAAGGVHALNFTAAHDAIG